MKSAIIYARVSTVGQADAELPVDSQLEACRKRAAELGARVDREFVDAGLSGRTDERPAFREALAYCRAGKIDHFICWSTSRFARNYIDAGWYQQQLRKHGTQCVFCSSTYDRSTKDGWLAETIVTVFDELYSRQVSEDTTRSMMKNARDGCFNGGVLPFGYRLEPFGKRKRLAVHADESITVRRIFDLCAAGMGAKSIAMKLNDEGATRRGARWTAGNVSILLSSWVYAGYTVFNRRNRKDKTVRPESEWIKTRSHDAIIDEEQFMKIRSLIGARAPIEGKGSPHSTHLLTGILKCGGCGKSMMIETATGRSSTYSYYNCGTWMKSGACASRRVPSGDLDAWVIDIITSRVLTDANLREIVSEMHHAAGQWASERDRRRVEIVGAIRRNETSRRKLYELLEASAPADLNLADIGPRLRHHNAEELRLSRELAELENAPAPNINASDIEISALREFVADTLRSSGNRERVRGFLGSFVERIDLEGAQAAIHYRKDRILAASSVEVVHGKNDWLPIHEFLRTAVLAARLPARWVRAA